MRLNIMNLQNKRWLTCTMHLEVFIPDLLSPETRQLMLTLSAHLRIAANHPDCSDAARYIGNRLEGFTLATADCYKKQLAL